MSHTFTAKSGRNFHHNGDFSGRVTFLANCHSSGMPLAVDVPFADLLELFYHYQERLSEEAMEAAAEAGDKPALPRRTPQPIDRTGEAAQRMAENAATAEHVLRIPGLADWARAKDAFQGQQPPTLRELRHRALLESGAPEIDDVHPRYPSISDWGQKKLDAWRAQRAEEHRAGLDQKPETD